MLHTHVSRLRQATGAHPRPKSRRMPLSWLVALLALSGLPGGVSATENDRGYWAVFSTTDAFPSADGASRWHYWFDAQARYADLGSGANQFLARPAIGYALRGSLKGWVGYARFRTRNKAGRVADENRFWQQLDWRAGRWRGGNVTMRVRLAQRSVSAGNDTGVWVRYMAKYVRPIGRDGKTSLVLALEPFVDLKDTDWGGKAGLRQNRVAVGLGWRLSDRITLEAGYMNQYLVRDNAANISNHLALFNIKAKLGNLR